MMMVSEMAMRQRAAETDDRLEGERAGTVCMMRSHRGPMPRLSTGAQNTSKGDASCVALRQARGSSGSHTALLRFGVHELARLGRAAGVGSCPLHGEGAAVHGIDVTTRIGQISLCAGKKL